MTNDLYHMLLAWLESGDDAQKRHAAYRLNLPDAIGYVPGVDPPAPPPAILHAVPPIVKLDPVLLKIHACPDYNPGCCASPMPFCTRYTINPTRDQCVECLEGSPPR